MRAWWLAACVVMGCGDSRPPSSPPREVMAIGIPTPKLDLVFVVSNEVSTNDVQAAWVNAFPALLAEVSIDGRPDLHIGAITPDLGTQVASGDLGPAIGGTMNGCTGSGDAGLLRPAGDGTDRYLIDSDTQVNHAGPLSVDVRSLVEYGSGGCGFQQHLAAVRAAFANPSNAGFRRSDAALGIVIVSDEDDCSALDPNLFSPGATSLGPVTHFRCTQFGVRCAESDMTSVGPRTACTPDASSQIIEDPADFVPMFRDLAGDPRRLAFGAVIARGDVAIELRAPTGSTDAVPALAHACRTPDPYSISADPAVRLAWLAGELGDRGAVASICDDTLDSAATTIGMNLRRAMGSSCIEEDIDVSSCDVVQERLSMETPLPACNGGSGTCYEITTDATLCPHGDHRRLVVRGGDTIPGTYTLVRC